MNTQTVSAQTARLLADAGFPQPAPAPGQWWGNGENLILVLLQWKDQGRHYIMALNNANSIAPFIDDYFDGEDFTGLVYLPTAGDILRELPGITIGYFPVTNGGYTIYDRLDSHICTHESEHEAAALAWLSLHEKK